MGSDLGERLIADHKAIAKQRWRKLSFWVKHHIRIHIPSSGFTSILALQYVKQASICCTKKEKFRIAMFFSQAAIKFIDGIDVLDRDSQDNELTESTEETDNVGSSYYSQQCDQLVAAAVVVNMTSHLCQGCFKEECNSVSSLHLAKPSEPEPAANDCDGHGAMEIPSSDQTVLDTVNGLVLNSSPLSHTCVSPDNYDYSETNQAPGHDDSNRGESPLLSVASDHAVTRIVPDHVVLDVLSSDTEHPSRRGTNVSPDQPLDGRRVIFETQCYN